MVLLAAGPLAEELSLIVGLPIRAFFDSTPLTDAIRSGGATSGVRAEASDASSLFSCTLSVELLPERPPLIPANHRGVVESTFPAVEVEEDGAGVVNEIGVGDEIGVGVGVGIGVGVELGVTSPNGAIRKPGCESFTR